MQKIGSFLAFTNAIYNTMILALFFRCFVLGQSNKNTSVKVYYLRQKLKLRNQIWQKLVFDPFPPIPSIKSFVEFLQAEKICISLLDRPRLIYVKNRAVVYTYIEP